MEVPYLAYMTICCRMVLMQNSFVVHCGNLLYNIFAKKLADSTRGTVMGGLSIITYWPVLNNGVCRTWRLKSYLYCALDFVRASRL